MRPWLALSVAVAACAPGWFEPRSAWDQPGQIVVCVNLPERNMAEARAAVELWDDALWQWKRVHFVDSAPHEGCDKTVQEAPEAFADHDAQLAWTSRVGGDEIYMIRGRYEYDVRGILLHELGHAFGAQHLPGTMMNAVIHPFVPHCPDSPTVAQVAAWNDVDLSILSWCMP